MLSLRSFIFFPIFPIFLFFTLFLSHLTDLSETLSASETNPEKRPFLFFHFPQHPPQVQCQSASNKYIFANPTNNYQFRIIFNFNNLPEAYRSKERERNLEFLIYSFPNRAVSSLVKKIPLRLIRQNGQCYGQPCTLWTYDFNLLSPYPVADIQNTYKNIEQFPWNLIVTLRDKTEKSSEKKNLALTSYALRLLSEETVLYEKSSNDRHLYSLSAFPASKILDNSQSEHSMRVLLSAKPQTQNKKAQNKNNKIKIYKAGQGLVSDSFNNLTPSENNPGTDKPSLRPIDLISLFSQGKISEQNWKIFLGPLHQVLLQNVSFDVLYSAPSLSAGTQIQQIRELDNSLNRHFILPSGDIGLVYGQDHVEETLLNVYGRDKCGLLSKLSENKVKIVDRNFSLINLDKNLLQESHYLKNLSSVIFPVYDYFSQKNTMAKEVKLNLHSASDQPKEN